jgi:Concanavalin A-like lectin/glucanases superfamily/Beta-propeller repeat
VKASWILTFLVAAGVPGHAQTLDWAKKLAGNSDITHLELAGNGDVLVGGYFYGTNDFDPGAGTASLTSVGSADTFIARYDAVGNYLWAKRIGGTGSEYVFGVAVDSAGNLYVGGYFSGTVDFDPGSGVVSLVNPGLYYNPFVAKYSPAGSLVWARGLLGTGGGYLRGLVLDASANVVVSGTFTGTLDFDPGTTVRNVASSNSFNLFLAKYSATGQYLWASNIDATGDIYFPSLALDAAGNSYVTARFSGTLDANPASGVANVSGGSAPHALFLGKYNSSGTYQWSRAVPFAANDDLAVGRGLTVSANGSIVVTGYFTSSADFGAQTLTSFGDWDAFVAKYSATNVPIFAVQLGGSGPETGSAVVTDAANDIYVVGGYYGDGDYDPSPSGVATLAHLGPGPNSAGSEDTFLVKLTAAGAYSWAHAVASGSDDHFKDVTLVGSKLFLNGFTHGNVDFDFGSGTTTVGQGSAAAKYSLSLSCSPVASGLGAWFPLDETSGSTVNDVVGTVSGTASGAVPSSAGKVNFARTFDGTDDLVSVPSYGALDFGTGDFSVQAWVKTTDADGVLLGKRQVTGSGYLGYILMVYSGRPLLQMADPAASWANYLATTGPVVNDGQWHLVTATVDRDSPTGGKLWLDGTPVHTFNPIGRAGSLSNASALEFGMINGTSPLAGTLDEVRLYNRVLTANEIANVVAASGVCTSGPPLAGTLSCVATAPDGSHHSCTATATGGTGGYQYLWSGSGGVFADPSGATVSVSIPACQGGAEFVHVQVFDSAGNSANVSLEIACDACTEGRICYV